MARSTSAMPGPQSLAMMAMPDPFRPLTASRRISPLAAYDNTFLASSEIAVAILTTSVGEKPSSTANARPFCLATMMSLSESIGTRT